MADQDIKTIYAADPAFHGKIQVEGPDGKRWAVPRDAKLPDGYKVVAKFAHTADYKPDIGVSDILGLLMRAQQGAGVTSTKQLLGQETTPQERARQFAVQMMMGAANPTLPLDIAARVNELVGGGASIPGLLAGRAYQGGSPMSSPQSEPYFEAEPVQQAADRLGKAVGDVPAAAMQFGAQMVPQLAQGMGGAAGGARLAEEAVGNAPGLVKAGASAIGAGAENLAQSMVMAGSGAEPGNIQRTALDAASDPLNLAMAGGLGVLHGLPQARQAIREAQMKNEVDSLQETFAKAKQALAQQVVTSPEVTKRVFVPEETKVNPRQIIGTEWGPWQDEHTTVIPPDQKALTPEERNAKGEVVRVPNTNPRPSLKKTVLPGQIYDPERTEPVQSPDQIGQQVEQAKAAGLPEERAAYMAARARRKSGLAADAGVKMSAAEAEAGTPAGVQHQQLSPIRELMQAEREQMQEQHPGHFAEDTTAIKDRAAEILRGHETEQMAMVNREANAGRLEQAQLEGGGPRNLRDVEPTSPGNKPGPPSTQPELKAGRKLPPRKPNEGDTTYGGRMMDMGLLPRVGGGGGFSPTQRLIELRKEMRSARAYEAEATVALRKTIPGSQAFKDAWTARERFRQQFNQALKEDQLLSRHVNNVLEQQEYGIPYSEYPKGPPRDINMPLVKQMDSQMERWSKVRDVGSTHDKAMAATVEEIGGKFPLYEQTGSGKIDYKYDPLTQAYSPNKRLRGRADEMLAGGAIPVPEVGGGSGGKPELHVTEVDPRAQNITRPPVEMSDPPPPIHPEQLNAMQRAAKALGDRSKEFTDRLKKELSLPENRAGEEAAYAIRQLNAVRQMNDHAVKQVFPELRASMKGQNSKSVQQTIGQLRDLMDNIDLHDVRSLTDAADKAGMLEASLPDAFRHNYAKVKAANQEMLKYLIDRGWLSAEAARDAALKMQLGIPWLHREFLSILDKRWKPPEDVYNKTIDEVMRRNKSLSPELARQQLDHFLNEFKGQVAKGKSFRDAFLKASAGNDALKARSMPEWLRPFLGVINDPSFVVAQSFGELNRMYHQALVTDAMTKPEFKGTVWSDKPALNMHPERLGQGMETHEAKKMYGEFAGKYVTPEVHEALHDASGPVINGMMHEMASGFVNIFRASKVLTSPTTIARNFLGNFMYQMAAGIPPHRWPLLFTRAVRSMSDWGRHGQPIISAAEQPGMAKWTQMAVEDGALRPGRGYDVQGSELRHLVKYVIDRPDAGALKPMFDTYGKFINKLGAVYSVMDDVHRLMAYMHTVETGLGMGMSDAQARARASATVNRYFASGASVGPAFKKLGNYGAGVVNPFMAFQVDNARVFKNVIQDAAKGNVGPLIRVALATGSIYGLGSMLRTKYGISDQDVASAEAARTPYMTENNPFPLYLPWRTNEGYIHMANIEAVNPFYMYLKGSGDIKDPKNLAGRIGTNLVLGLVNSGMIEPFVKGQLGKLGAPAQSTYNENVLPSQEGMASVQALWDTMKPTYFKQFMDTMRKAQLAGHLRQGEEPLTPGEAAGKLLGGMDVAGIEKVGKRTLFSATQARNAEMANLQKSNQQATKELRQGNIDVPELNKNFSINADRARVIMERSAKMAEVAKKKAQPVQKAKKK